MLAFALFIGLPILEIVLLVQAGIAFGFWWLLAWIFASAAIGIILVKRQGLAAVRQAQAAQAEGEIPVGPILTGIRLAFAGMFLIVPGFITDGMGLLLLLPWTGNTLGRVVAARVRMHSTWRGGPQHGPYGPSHAGDGQNVDIVDADFEVVSTSDPNRRDPPAKPPGKPPGKPPLIRDDNPWKKP